MTTNSVNAFEPLKESKFATIVERLYKFYFQNRTGPYILYGVTFFVVFTYAALRMMVWRGAQWGVIIECAVLTSLSLIGIPLALSAWRVICKRVIDVVGAAALLIICAPLMLLIALLVKLTSPGPVLFVRERLGLNKQRFPMFKFRTMIVDAEEWQKGLEAFNEAEVPVFKMKDDPRVTPVGRWLRKTSLDELPQFFNVLRGELSLVGPRPLPVREFDRFNEYWFSRRFSVKPGITCIWQVSERSETSFDQWIRQDLEYVDKWSLTLDLKILLKTIPVALRGQIKAYPTDQFAER